jgi:hypothetical protein
MVLVISLTLFFAIVVGRHTNARGLVLTSTVVFVASAVLFAYMYSGAAAWLLIAFNVAAFEIVAVSFMLFLPSTRRLDLFCRPLPAKSGSSK